MGVVDALPTSCCFAASEILKNEKHGPMEAHPVFLLIVCYLLSLYTKYIVLVIDYTPASGGAGKNVYLFEVYIFLLPLAKLISLP